MSALVVVDADVLGRERTGDETYVRNLLRELAPLAGCPARASASQSSARSRSRTAEMSSPSMRTVAARAWC